MPTAVQTRLSAQQHRHSMGRREFITLIGSSALNWPYFAHAQQQPQPGPMKRLGILSSFQCQVPEKWWADHFREFGWIQGEKYVLECVSTVGRLDQLPALARELVSRHPDVLVAGPNTFIKALKQETMTIPIVMFLTADPVQSGLVTNLARPEGNVTGVATFIDEVLAKRIQLLKEIVPQLRRLAVIWRQLSDPESNKNYEDRVTTAASKLGVSWQLFRPVVAKDYDEIFARIAAEHFDAAYIQTDPLSNLPENVTRISQLALRHLIPTTSDNVQMAKAGVLLTYAQDSEHDDARVLSQVDKLLRGAKPSDLPVEQGTVFQLKINLKTAEALGLTVPPSLLAQADEVIE